MFLGGKSVNKLAESLKKILDKYSIKQVDLAKSLGVSPQFINGVFKGRKKLNFKQIEIMGDKLNLRKEDILELKKRASNLYEDQEMMQWLENIENVEEKHKELSADEKMQEIIENIFKIKDDKAKEEILDFILYKIEKNAKRKKE